MPPRSPRKRPVSVLDSASQSSSSEDDEESSGSGSDAEIAISKSRSRKQGHDEPEDKPGFLVQAGFDAYFYQSSARSVTSNHVFSTLIPPLTADEYVDAIRNMPPSRAAPLESSINTEDSKIALFARFMRELQEGFNLLFHGFGSKRRFLNSFATERCAKEGHVVVANGFHPGFAFKDLLGSFDNIPELSETVSSSSSVENQVARIHEFFLASPRHLYLIVHNIDAPAFRSTKIRSYLSLWALNPHIHLVASIDHINASLLWSTPEMSARKRSRESAASSAYDHMRGFSWLWHDITTLLPYDFELSFADRSSIQGARGGRKGADGAAIQVSAAAMSETAALHILASVTQKAKKLFQLMGARQLESIDSATEEGAVAQGKDMQQHSIAYDALFNLARDNFVATNDTAMRMLLGEFRDHGLVLSAQSGSAGGEALWIPLRKERLACVIQSLQAE
ncbi:hypothetical protein HGRIS_000349 [Hohenbuehelia grisea]|uniref:Origin recognition complex subunit 2 n=1 Tax=Hohenbuehelia grisea TaxID=104357 RepID=A0ABR3JQZ2_9AGAR